MLGREGSRVTKRIDGSMMQTSVHLPREDTGRELGIPAYAKLLVNLTFLHLS
jgi:hypothetical protein